MCDSQVNGEAIDANDGIGEKQTSGMDQVEEPLQNRDCCLDFVAKNDDTANVDEIDHSLQPLQHLTYEVLKDS